MSAPIWSDIRKAMMVSPLRERAWMTLAAGAGLRCAEIATLRWRDVVTDPSPALIVRGKGGKVRVVPASESVRSALRKVRGDQVLGDKVFVSRRLDGRPGHVAPHLVSIRGARALRAAGVDHTMHQLRHTFATQLYSATQDIVLVSELLGHSSILTTQRYVGLAQASAADAVGRVDLALRQGVDAA